MAGTTHKVVTWEELDDMLTCAGDVDDMIHCIWMAASDSSVDGSATGAIQTVAASAKTRLRGLRQSLEAYMELVRS